MNRYSGSCFLVLLLAAMSNHCFAALLHHYDFRGATQAQMLEDKVGTADLSVFGLGITLAGDGQVVFPGFTNTASAAYLKTADDAILLTGNPYAVSFWVWIDALQAREWLGFIASENTTADNNNWSWHVDTSASGDFRMRSKNANTHTNRTILASPPTGTWHHITICKNTGPDLQIWVNGADSPQTFDENIGELRELIVGANRNIDLGAACSIANIKIYNDVWTAALEDAAFAEGPQTEGFISAPTNITATAQGFDTIVLDWDDNPVDQNVTDYNVYRAEQSTGPFSVIASPTASTYTDTPLNHCNNYYYQITALTASDESAPGDRTEAAMPCIGDLNDDGLVNGTDAFLLALDWLGNQPGLKADIDESGLVNNVDLAAMNANWHAERPPLYPPNIVWIMGEDCGAQHFALFDPVHGAATPRLSQMADSGLTFTNTFSNAPVCSAARSALITGVLPTRLGIQWHRRIEHVTLPDDLLMFPAYLRQAGYYTTNSTKTDYNCISNGLAPWNNASAGEFGWRNRPTANTPFFHVRTYSTTHEGSLHSGVNSPTTDPASIVLPPKHPDTTTFRNTYATYHDKIKTLDNRIGDIIDALSADGLLEDTFVFFLGDHGGVLPGSKGYITDTGLHAPLVVRIPANFAYMTPQSPDGKVTGTVSFIDFAPTLLNLAGVEIPSHMEGSPFLGQGVTLAQVNARNETFSAADRFDELYNRVRSVHQGSFKYVRNYEPFYPYSLRNNFRYRMAAFDEWRNLFNTGSLNAAQSLFFQRRGAEELYDISVDPYEVHNLAGNPAHAATLAALRSNLQQRVTGMPDLGIMPEAVFLAESGDTAPLTYGQNNQARITRYVQIADLALRPFGDVSATILTHLGSTDPLDRYWALTVCASFGPAAAPLETDVRNAIASETSALALARAAVYLGEIGESNADIVTTLGAALAASAGANESLLVLNDVVHLRDTLGYDVSSFTAADVIGSLGLINNRTSYLGW